MVRCGFSFFSRDSTPSFPLHNDRSVQKPSPVAISSLNESSIPTISVGNPVESIDPEYRPKERLESNRSKGHVWQNPRPVHATSGIVNNVVAKNALLSTVDCSRCVCVDLRLMIMLLSCRNPASHCVFVDSRLRSNQKCRIYTESDTEYTDLSIESFNRIIDRKQLMPE